MSIQNAMTFIKRVSTDNKFRQNLYEFNSRDEILSKLEKEGKSFTIFEFEEAINMLHVKCQSYEEADQVKQIEWWFGVLGT